MFVRTLKVSFSTFGSGAIGDLGDSGFVNRLAGDERALIGSLALGVGDGQSDPGDEQGILAFPQRNIVEPLQMMAAQRAGLDLTPGVLLGGGPGNEVIEGLVGGGFGGEQEVATGFDHGLGDRLAGKQIIAQIDRT